MSTAFPFATNRALNRREISIVSGASSVEFTDLDSSHFYYEIDLLGLIPSNNGVILYTRTSTNNGSSYDSGASDYTYIQESVGVSSGLVNNGATASFIETNPFGIGTGANVILDMTVGLFNPSATNYANFENIATGITTTPETWVGKCFGIRLSAADVDAIQFVPSAGTISGTFILREYIA